jgi:SET domain-containing protein
VRKKALLKELTENTFVALRPSPIDGIGVFAIRDIPAGCRNMFSAPKKNWIKLSKSKIGKLPQHSIDLIENYCLWDDKNYYVPDHGFKIIDMVVFLNHSDMPNIRSLNEGDFFETTRDISSGEELFLDYDTIVE